MNTRWMKALALLIGLTVAAAACGSDSDSATPTTVAPTADDAMEDDAMEDDAMEDDAMEDDAMEDDAMEDDAMEDDAMEDDAMEDDAMEDDAMAMEEGTHVLHLEIEGLEAAGSGNDYQVWSVVDGSPVAGGAFDIVDGKVKISGDQGHLYIFDNTDSIFITVESESRSDGTKASDTQVLSGDVDSSGAVKLTGVGDSSASGTGETR